MSNFVQKHSLLILINNLNINITYLKKITIIINKKLDFY